MCTFEPRRMFTREKGICRKCLLRTMNCLVRKADCLGENFLRPRPRKTTGGTWRGGYGSDGRRAFLIFFVGRQPSSHTVTSPHALQSPRYFPTDDEDARGTRAGGVALPTRRLQSQDCLGSSEAGVNGAAYFGSIHNYQSCLDSSHRAASTFTQASCKFLPSDLLLLEALSKRHPLM